MGVTIWEGWPTYHLLRCERKDCATPTNSGRSLLSAVMGCGASGTTGVTAVEAMKDSDRIEMSKAEFERKIGQFGFDKADEDGSDRISKDEWSVLFATLDTNGDGVVDKEEWEVAFGAGSFTRWDANGDQMINYEEWCKIYLNSNARAKKKTKRSRRTSRRSSTGHAHRN